jgi:hypothetical protein
MKIEIVVGCLLRVGMDGVGFPRACRNGRYVPRRAPTQKRRIPSVDAHAIPPVLHPPIVSLTRDKGFAKTPGPT